MKKIIKLLIIIIFVFISAFIYYGALKYKRYNNKEVIVFLGDSQIARYNLGLYYMSFNMINSGVGGNLTDDILDNIYKRVLKYNPKKVFIEIGTNDIAYTNLSLKDINDKVELIIDEIKAYDSNIDIYLESIYPVIEGLNEDIVYNRKNSTIKELNSYLRDTCTDKCTYVDLYSSLIDQTGNLNRLYTKDGVHLNHIGYFKISQILYKYLNE